MQTAIAMNNAVARNRLFFNPALVYTKRAPGSSALSAEGLDRRASLLQARKYFVPDRIRAMETSVLPVSPPNALTILRAAPVITATLPQYERIT